MGRSSQSLYKQVVEATAIYLGPSADRFISQQIVGHLNKAPEKLIKSDLNEIVKWIKPAMALLNEDSKLVDHYIDNLLRLIGSSKKDS